MVQASHFKAQVDEEITHWWLSMSHIVFWIYLSEARNLIPVNLNHLKSCKIYSWRPLGIIMDDHDQPMSFLDPLHRYLQGLGVRPPFIACCSSCKGNGAWMGSCFFTGWRLTCAKIFASLVSSSFAPAWWPGLPKSCRLPAAAAKLFKLKCTWNHVMKAGKLNPLCKMQKPLDSKLSHSICLLALPPMAAQAPATAAMSSCERPAMTFRMACACWSPLQANRTLLSVVLFSAGNWGPFLHMPKRLHNPFLSSNWVLLTWLPPLFVAVLSCPARHHCSKPFPKQATSWVPRIVY